MSQRDDSGRMPKPAHEWRDLLPTHIDGDCQRLDAIMTAGPWGAAVYLTLCKLRATYSQGWRGSRRQLHADVSEHMPRTPRKESISRALDGLRDAGVVTVEETGPYAITVRIIRIGDTCSEPIGNIGAQKIGNGCTQCEEPLVTSVPNLVTSVPTSGNIRAQFGNNGAQFGNIRTHSVEEKRDLRKEISPSQGVAPSGDDPLSGEGPSPSSPPTPDPRTTAGPGPQGRPDEAFAADIPLDQTPWTLLRREALTEDGDERTWSIHDWRIAYGKWYQIEKARREAEENAAKRAAFEAVRAAAKAKAAQLIGGDDER